MDSCNRLTLCKTMRGQLVMSGRGFQSWEQVRGGKVVLMGVLFKGVGDRPLLVNYCPWCGGLPGEKGDQAAKPDPFSQALNEGDGVYRP